MGLVKKIYMECPLCGILHEVEERERPATAAVKGEDIVCEERYYLCPNTEGDDKEFKTDSLRSANQMNARNAYRIRHDLLTSDQIIEIRESYGLSQVDLSRLLGWGEATVSRYESRAIQEEAYDAMLRLIKDNPLQALEFLKRNGDKFTGQKRRDIRAKIVEKLDSYGKEFLTRQLFEGEYVNYDVPSDSNGYTLLDIDKIESVVSYFAERIPNLFKVKLMKLLWYADALAYKLRGKAMTGLVYRHEAMGALPIGHYSLMNLEKLDVREEFSLNYDLMLHIYPDKSADYSKLDREEKKVLDTVAARFKSCKAAEVVEYMHGERAYKETAPGAVIPFSLAGEIRDF